MVALVVTPFCVATGFISLPVRALYTVKLVCLESKIERVTDPVEKSICFTSVQLKFPFSELVIA